MKIKLIFSAFLIVTINVFSQTLFNTSFGNLSLQTYTTTSSITQYTTVPSSFNLINDGFKNNIGSISNPNKPFNVPTLKSEGWAVTYNASESDTFLVSTSWLDTLATANRWIITPPISNISANTVITWLAKSPDPNYKESYILYGTNKSGTLSPQDFTIGDQLFSSVAENSEWTRRSVNIGSFAGQTLRFAFRNNSSDKYQLWLDDIEIITLPLSVDVAINSIQNQKYVLTGSTNTISANVINLGANTLNSLVLNYTIGNSTVQTETINFSSGLAYKQQFQANFALPYSIATAGNYKLKIWLTNSSDQNHLNDTASTYITIQNTSAKKKVMVEQFVSAFDGESPDAQQKLTSFQNDSVIVINIHDLDSLKEINSSLLLSEYKKKSSTALIDRTNFYKNEDIALPRPYYAALINQQLLKTTPATISITNKTFNAVTRVLSFTVKADFIGDVKADLRLNAYLVENEVHGPSNDFTINGYNQLSNFYNIPWSPYYQLGSYSSLFNANLLNAYQYKHQNTLVHSFDGAYGNSGLIPSTGGTQNQSYQKTYTLTIPNPINGVNKYNLDNLYIIGFLAEYNTDKNNRIVLNCTKEKVNSNSGTNSLTVISLDKFLTMYPNPSNGRINLKSSKKLGNCNITVIDALGKCVLTQKLSVNSGHTTLDYLSLPSGIYFLNISSESGRFVEKLIIQKN